MPLDPEDKQRLMDAYKDHVRALDAFDGMGPCDGATASNESRYFTTEARFERIADEIGVGPEHYEELQQMVEQDDALRQAMPEQELPNQELGKGPSIGGPSIGG